MPKALTQMHVELDTVWNDVMGKSGEAIVRSVVVGERDATVLARMCARGVKADMATVAGALQGKWRAEHAVALSQALGRHDCYAAQLLAVEEQVVETLKDGGLDEEMVEGWRQAPTRPATGGARGDGGRDCVDDSCGAWWRPIPFCDERAL